MKTKLIVIVSGLLIALLFGGCAVSLAADVTPPPSAESFTAQNTPVASESVFPIVPPDTSQGETLFDEKCSPCHGSMGLGDGPQAGQLPVPVAALGDPILADKSKPVDWYEMVTQGNLERYMPGFSSLDNRQRWDVVAYALTLSMDPNDVDQGKVVFEQNCQVCHGESGQGSSEAPSWLEDATRLAKYSINDIVDTIDIGYGTMPEFGSVLSQAEMKAVAVYIRTLSFKNFVNPVALQEPTLQATPETGANEGAPALKIVTIQGNVTNVSGGDLPDGLLAVLTGFSGMEQVSQQQTGVTNGVYKFENVEISSGQTYMVTIDYQGLSFGSDIYHTSDADEESIVNLPIEFYDTSSDTSPLRAERMHIFFDFSNPETVQVVELLILNNTGNYVIVPEQSGSGVVNYDLPEGASNLQFDDSTLGDRYLATESGFTDTAAIGPGSGQQILFAYEVPYSRKMTLDIPIPIDVDAAIVMLPQGTMNLQSDQLQSTGQRDVQGVSLELYTASDLPDGSILSIKLSGRGNSGLSFQLGQTTGLLIGAVVFGVALVIAGYWLLRQRRLGTVKVTDNDLPVQESAEDLMDAIIALDDQYKAGELPDEAYQRRRDELKDCLKARMK